jgi:chemotaxis protein CheY-P-specific phosphatase CheC
MLAVAVVSLMALAEAFLVLAVPVVAQLARLLAQTEPLTLAAEQAAEMEMSAIKAQAVQDLSAFATLTLSHLQHQQQVHLQSQHQAVTEFTNGQEAGA